MKTDITEKIKTIADVLSDNGLTQEQFDEKVKGMESDTAAYELLKLIVSSLNEKRIPNWNDPNEAKYVPWFDMRGSSGFRCRDFDGWVSLSRVGSRLCFLESRIAEYAGETFPEVYKRFMVIE